MGKPLASQLDRTKDQRSIFRLVSFATPKEIAKLVAPLLVMALALVADAAMPAVYPEGYVETYYPAFLLVSIVIYMVLVALSIWFQPVRKKVIHFWGLLIAAYLLLAVYTYNTVKTGNSSSAAKAEAACWAISGVRSPCSCKGWGWAS